VITSKGVSSLLTIPAGNTTITNAPPLQNNAVYRFFFTSQITGSDDTTAMSISYNGTSYSVKATSNGSLKDFTAYPIATEQTRELKKGEKSEEEKGETKGETKSGTRATVTTYVYCQSYTTLETMFDGTKFIIMGNPVVISNSDYTVYTDGSITYTATSTFEKLEVRDYRQQTINFNLTPDVGRALIFFEDSSGTRQAFISICNFGGVLRKIEIVNTAGVQIALNNTETINCTLIYDSNPQYRVLIF
jgi:hypothetical protein